MANRPRGCDGDCHRKSLISLQAPDDFVILWYNCTIRQDRFIDSGDTIIYAVYKGKRFGVCSSSGGKSMLTCFDVAEFFIHLANETGSYISNLKLQKLVYYAQAWHLALYNEPLFEEDFEAWVHGPVIPALYQKYKKFSWKPIQEEVEEPDIPEDILDFLGEVVKVYFGCDAYYLERMTHQENPWIQARGSLLKDDICDEIITKESMREYFKARAEESGE